MYEFYSAMVCKNVNYEPVFFVAASLQNKDNLLDLPSTLVTSAGSTLASGINIYNAHCSHPSQEAFKFYNTSFSLTNNSSMHKTNPT